MVFGVGAGVDISITVLFLRYGPTPRLISLYRDKFPVVTSALPLKYDRYSVCTEISRETVLRRPRIPYASSGVQAPAEADLVPLFGNETLLGGVLTYVFGRMPQEKTNAPFCRR
jgi:hypothetical protein